MTKQFPVTPDLMPEANKTVETVQKRKTRAKGKRKKTMAAKGGMKRKAKKHTYGKSRKRTAL